MQVPPPIRSAAERLAGLPATAIAGAGTGANSRIFRVETARGTYALKCYPARAGDARDRAGTEWRALTFLRTRGIGAVPQPFARDPDGQYLLMEWIAGAPVIRHDAADVAAAADFITAVFALSADPRAQDFPPASEACLSAAEIVRQIRSRRSALAPEARVAHFVAECIEPAFEAHRRAGLADPSAQTPLAPALRRLIPADFGFHNALRTAEGRLRYIDFDYFGWDDPVKLAADFLLHPAMALTAGEKDLFAARLRDALPDDADFAARLARTLPLYAIRWALILLNPFRADRAGELPADAQIRAALIEERIGKAKAVLAAGGA